MSINVLTAKIYKFTLHRNQYTEKRVDLDNLYYVGSNNNFSRGQVRYAISLLKSKDMLRYYPKSGWVAMKI